MTTRFTEPKRIVVAVDFSEPSEVALDAGLRRVAIEPETELHVVHAIAEGGVGKTMRILNQDVLLSELPKTLHAWVARRSAAMEVFPVHLGIHVRVGDPVRAIVQMTVDVAADLLIVGTHGRQGFSRAVMGSVAEHVIRVARCPVLVARTTTYMGLTPSEQIEPPCAECVATRRASAGESWWCETHARRYAPTHTYSSTGSWTHGSADSHGFGRL